MWEKKIQSCVLYQSVDLTFQRNYKNGGNETQNNGLHTFLLPTIKTTHWLVPNLDSFTKSQPCTELIIAIIYPYFGRSILLKVTVILG